jgi:hypothetical protein
MTRPSSTLKLPPDRNKNKSHDAAESEMNIGIKQSSMRRQNQDNKRMQSSHQSKQCLRRCPIIVLRHLHQAKKRTDENGQKEDVRMPELSALQRARLQVN